MNMKIPENELTFVMLVGLPGSGKSTWLKTADLVTSKVVSSDDIIEELAAAQGLTYSDVWASNIKYATKEMNRRFEDAILGKHNIVWDQTNLSAKKRMSVLQRVPNIYKKYAVVFNTAMDEIERRIHARFLETGKNIPKSVLLNMYNTFEQPELNEGFTGIITI